MISVMIWHGISCQVESYENESILIRSCCFLARFFTWACRSLKGWGELAGVTELTGVKEFIS